jgi:hypothetical protein
MISSITFVWNISRYTKNWTRYYQKYTKVFMYSALYSSQILTNIEFSQHIFEKIIKYKISRTSVQWEPNCSTRKDRQTWRSFLIFAKTTKNKILNYFCIVLTNSPNFQKKIFLAWWWLQGLPPEALDSGSQSKWEWPLNRSPDAHRASSPSEG